MSPRRQEAKSLELRAAMSLARLWQQQGKRTAAYALLAEPEMAEMAQEALLEKLTGYTTVHTATQ